MQGDGDQIGDKGFAKAHVRKVDPADELAEDDADAGQHQGEEQRPIGASAMQKNSPKGRERGDAQDGRGDLMHERGAEILSPPKRIHCRQVECVWPPDYDARQLIQHIQTA